MTQPLMPLATAVWLVENTTLTFEQIANLCNFHEMEVQGIADGEIGTNIEGQNPIFNGQLTAENIKECEANPEKKLNLISIDVNTTKKVKKYVPIAKRRDKPDAISWIIKNYPEIPDSKIVKLIGTTKKTIEAIKNRTHANMSSIQPKDPVLLGICNQSDLDALVAKFYPKSEAEA